MWKSILKNWFTSLFGTVAGIPQIVEGLSSTPKNWSLVISGLATLVLGLSAKDANVR